MTGLHSPLREPEAVEGPVGNVYDKYGSKNPLARALVDGFLGVADEFYKSTAASSVLEVGCGEGKLATRLMAVRTPAQFVACDLSLHKLAADADTRIKYLPASVYELPFPDRAFDLIVCCEVLEHLEEPDRGLKELARVCKQYVLLSTPREPLWRVLNMARGKYWTRFGNTPGHIQHFSSTSLLKTVSKYFTVVACRKPLPWTMILGRV
jgi:ubiquinone/menaquinone biosynthesis C-methylase UbiE